MCATEDKVAGAGVEFWRYVEAKEQVGAVEIHKHGGVAAGHGLLQGYESAMARQASGPFPLPRRRFCVRSTAI